MKPDQMVHMANQIAAFFASYPREEAIEEVADHFKKFWERRMLEQAFQYVGEGGSGLHEIAVEALHRLHPAKP